MGIMYLKSYHDLRKFMLIGFPLLPNKNTAKLIAIYLENSTISSKISGLSIRSKREIAQWRQV